MEGKELAEYVIKRIVGGDVFFAGNSDAISFIQKEIPDITFECTEKQVKLRGYEERFDLYFIKKDAKFITYTGGMVMGAGGNFETLLGILLEGRSRVLRVHVYYIGSEFDLDKMSEMIYSLFTEIGNDKIKKTKETYVIL